MKRYTGPRGEGNKGVQFYVGEGNAKHEERFGHVFIVFASGKNAEEMLCILNGRLGNSPEVEVSIF